MRTPLTHLKLNIRRLMAQRAFWFAAIAVGLASVLFAQMVTGAEHEFVRWRYDSPWLPFLVTPLGGMLCLWMTRRWFGGAEGGGIPQVMVELNRNEGDTWKPLVSLRIAIGKIMMCALAIGSGFSLGREAPAVQIGASIMASVRQRIGHARMIKERHLLVAGGAAGIAAAFNTPLAGVLFAIEELNRNVESRMSGLIITAIILAGFVARAMTGNESYFGQVLVSGSSSTVVLLVLASAFTAGVLGGLFTRLILSATIGPRAWLSPLRTRHPYRVVAVCGLIIALCGWITDGAAHGTGFDEIISMLEHEQDMPWYFAPAKLVATLASALSALPGGVFAPALAIGAGIGNDIYLLLGESAPQGMLIAFCMCGFLAAVTQAPITSFVIVMEMVDGYSIVIGLMFTALMASGIAAAISPPLFTTQAKDILRRLRGYHASALRPEK
ncbi:MAG: chloride channel protein [Rhodocyclaceae bacterium]|jgi:H+/Cl- antiporter ClcA|nr:chloride channel protein [Rhodocyclaceae bacterium]MBK6908324.1 chloride channel protein [Rhodocyclaceae bacterium]